MRFNGAQNVGVAEFQTSLVPYPRIHIMLCSYAQRSRPTMYNQLAFMMVQCVSRHGKLHCVCLMYQGVVVPKDVDAAGATV